MIEGRVAFFLPLLSGGGAERVMLNVARGFVDRGQPVDVVAARAVGPFYAYVPLGARLIDLAAPRVLRSIPALVRYLKRTRPAALISSSAHGNVAALAAHRLAGVPTRMVVTIHNARSNGRAASLRAKLLTHVSRFCYPWADAVVAVSHGVAASVASVAKLDPERIRVIYNPVVTPDVLRAAQDGVRHPWFEPGAPPVILGVGRLTWEKDFPTLLRAFALVRRRRPARLLILGEGNERPALEALVAALELGEDVSLPGWERNPYAFMARASVFVLSSKSEGLPTVLIEALAAGTPVVSTDCISGPREILQDGRLGRLVPVGDAAALADAIVGQLSQPGHTASADAWRPFSLDVAVDRYFRLLEGARA